MQRPTTLPVSSRIGPAIARLGLWLEVVRDSFVCLMPLTFFGLGAVLLRNVPWDAYQRLVSSLAGDGWHERLDLVVDATNGVMGLALAPLVAAHLVRRLPRVSPNDAEVPAVMAAISALINFMLFVSVEPVSRESLGRSAMLQGLVIGIASAELLTRMVRVRWLNLASLPYDTEANFYHGIRLTPPVIASGLVMLAIVELSAHLPGLPHDAFAPLVAWSRAHGAAPWLLVAVATALNQALWFLKVNGGNILDVYGADLFAPVGTPYTSDLASRALFDTFVLLGGSGATCGLIVAILLTAKRGPQWRIAQVSAVPALFNINESLLYGLPIVMSSAYLVPFVCVPLLLCLCSVAAVESGWLVLLPVSLPWTTPPLVSGWLLTDSWRGALLQLFEIGLSTALYLPFVRKVEAARQQREANAVQVIMQTIQGPAPARNLLLRRHDEVGRIARGLLSDLRADLAPGRRALHLLYQPKHDRAGVVVGAEALLRWNHARHGAISPVVLVTLAEESQEIHRVGAWVLNEACACKARWNAAGHRDLTMAINLSPTQLTDPGLPDRVAAALRTHGLQACEIELEITESAEIPDAPAVESTLRRLAEMGVALSMDDFGMGHSSLLYMQRFPISSIKLDGSLTRAVLASGVTADVIRTIVALGRSQKVKVVAEFVESAPQRRMLIELGCDVFQGYFHSPPLSENDCLGHFGRHAGPLAPTALEVSAAAPAEVEIVAS